MLSLDFSATNQYLIRSVYDTPFLLGSVSNVLSGGADNLILRFDVSRLAVDSGGGTRPAQDVYRRHEVRVALPRHASISRISPIMMRVTYRKACGV